MRSIGNFQIESLRADLPERVPCGRAASLASETTQTEPAYRARPPTSRRERRLGHGAPIACRSDGERAVLKLIYAALIGTAQHWRGIQRLTIRLS
jgi:hypothetical protein